MHNFEMNKSESYDTPSFVESTCNRKNSVSIDNNWGKNRLLANWRELSRIPGVITCFIWIEATGFFHCISDNS